MTALTLDLAEEVIERIAERAAALLAERQDDKSSEDGWLRGAERIAAYIDSPRSGSTRSPQHDASRCITTARR